MRSARCTSWRRRICKTKVNTTKLTTMPADVTSGRHLLLPDKLTPSTMGTRGRMHGSRMVNTPAANSVSRIVMANLLTSVSQVVTGVTVGVFLQVILVVFLGRIERRCGHDLCDDLGRPFARMVHLRLHALGDLALLFAVIEDGRAVLRADVVALTIGRGRVVQAEEVAQDAFVGDH